MVGAGVPVGFTAVATGGPTVETSVDGGWDGCGVTPGAAASSEAAGATILAITKNPTKAASATATSPPAEANVGRQLMLLTLRHGAP